MGLEWAGSLQLAAPMDQEPALDSTVIESLRELQMPGGPNLLAELIVAFREDAGARLADLQHAITTGNCEKVQRAAHSLKGMCGAIGAHQMAALSGELERSATAATVDAQLASRLEGEFARVTAALQELL